MYSDIEETTWYCKKCKTMIANCIDIDYHNNVIHPDYDDIYVKSWYINGKKGISPYD